MNDSYSAARALGSAGAAATVGDARVARTAAFLALAASALLPAPARAQTDGGYDYPSVPTPPEVVREMLVLGGVGPRDTVYDLGSGDGRIAIRAAREFGAAGVGIEIDSSLVAEARREARRTGVGDRVRFIRGDFFALDLRPANVVTAYLLPRTMDELAPHLFRELRPGTRIVSHDFDMDPWPADSTTGRRGGVGGHTTLYRWVVPARVGGTWSLHPPDGDSLSVRIDQNYQRLRVRVRASTGRRVTGALVRGDCVRFVLSRPTGDTLRLDGRVEGERMRGRSGEGGWSARRTAYSDSSLVAWSQDPAGRGGPGRRRAPGPRRARPDGHGGK